MRINHNIASLNTYRQLSSNTALSNKSLERLSSGLRINRAGDDAAGLAISEKMRGQIRGLEQASRNAQDGISMIQTAEGALTETHAILQRMRELAVQSANDTNTETDRAEIQKEIDQLAIEITRIANNTEFNTQNLLNGGITANGLGENTFHIGANANQSLSINIKAMDAASLGVARDVQVGTLSNATDVTAVTLSGTLGTALTDGATLSLSANATAAKTTWSATDTGLTGMAIESTENSSTYNGYTITINKSGSTDADPSVSVAGNKITIVLASNATAVDADKLNSAFTAAGLSVTATGNATAVDTKTDLAASTAGLADDEVKLTIGSESVIVKNNATSATFTSDAYKGLTLTLDGSLNASTAATIDISTSKASAATFAGGVKTADAETKGGIDVSTRDAANTAITTIQNAIEMVSAERSKLGAYQNRLEHTINNLGAASENLTASESRIRDVDMAQEMMEFTKMNILSQAATAMLAQANQQPQSVLQLLGR
jgi:flagellin